VRYSSLKRSGMARVNEGSHSFTCHPLHHIRNEPLPAFSPQPQSITALWPVLISLRDEGRRLSWLGWLGEILRWFARPKTVTHPSSISRCDRELNSRPSSRKSNAETITEPHPVFAANSVSLLLYLGCVLFMYRYDMLVTFLCILLRCKWPLCHFVFIK